MSAQRFKNCLLACAEIYGKEVSAAVVDLWWMALKGYAIDAIEMAFRRHITSPDTGQWMPKPADIIRMLAGTSLDASMVAWTKVDTAVRVVGPYATVTFDDQIVQRVLQDMGGWIGINSKTDGEWPFIGNEFRTRYQGYRSRGETPACLPSLPGITEAENSRVGTRWDAQITLIGDPEGAARVRDQGVDRPALGVSRVGTGLLGGQIGQPSGVGS